MNKETAAHNQPKNGFDYFAIDTKTHMHTQLTIWFSLTVRLLNVLAQSSEHMQCYEPIFAT